MFLNTFLNTIKKVPYRNKGIFYSELFTFLWWCHVKQAHTILESGSLYGFSTEFLCQYWPGHVYSVDRQRLHNLDMPNLLTIQGEAEDEIPRLIKQNYMHNVGILIDGPKGDKALALKDECFKYNNVKVVAIHDLPEGKGELIHTHSPYWRMFLDSVGFQFDSYIETDYAAKYPKGPGMAIFIA